MSRSCCRLWSPRPRVWREENGSASLEFVSVGMLLLVPLVYLILVLSSLQGASLAAEGAARQGARLFAQAPDEATGQARLHRAVVLGLDDFGFTEDDGRVEVRCAPQPTSCLRRGGTVTVEIRIAVSLPFVPRVIRSVGVGMIPVVASATSPVSRLWVGE